MKRFVAILTVTFSISCYSQNVTPEKVAMECMRQMSQGVCYAKPDMAAVKSEKTILISGAGRVSLNAYLDYLNLFNQKNPNDPAMCLLALKYMINSPGSDHDKIARAMWTPK